MEEITNSFIEFLISQNETVIYAVLFASAVIENLFPPIPGDTITVLGAFLVGTGRLSFWAVYAATTAGSVLGFMTLFMAARLGKSFFEKKTPVFFQKEKIAAAQQKFKKYGYGVILINRFIPGMRSVISIASGLSKLHTGKTAAASLVSAAMWNLLWMEAGYSLGNNWDTVISKIDTLFRSYNLAAAAVISAALIVFILYKLKQKLKAERRY